MTGAADPRGAIRGLCEAIAPASLAQASGAERGLRGAPPGEEAVLERLAIWLAGARHAPAPSTDRKRILVAAGDHGVGHPGIDLGETAPTREALGAIAEGRAALAKTARQTGAEIALVDAGIFGTAATPAGVVELRAGAGTADLREGPAMTEDEAALCVASGAALLFSLAEEGLDVAALGALGLGADVASAAVIASFANATAEAVGGEDDPDIAAALALPAPDPADPLSVLAARGGFELGALAGAILAAASIHVPVIVDGVQTVAAAVLASALAPNTRGYILPAHPGSAPAQRVALSALEPAIAPLLSVGVSRGEGTGGALALPALDAAAALLKREEGP